MLEDTSKIAHSARVSEGQSSRCNPSRSAATMGLGIFRGALKKDQ
jgi:hypothetical protein